MSEHWNFIELLSVCYCDRVSRDRISAAIDRFQGARARNKPEGRVILRTTRRECERGHACRLLVISKVALSEVATFSLAQMSR